MRVLALPDYTLQNPYQWLLARALETRGTGTVLSDGVGPSPLLGAVSAYGAPDVIHLHWPHPFLARRGRAATAVAALHLLAELALLRARGIGLVWTVHNLVAHDAEHAGVERWFNSALARLAGALIVHGPAARDAVARDLRLGARERPRVRVVPHGHYRDAYPVLVGRDSARTRLGAGESNRLVLYLGQLRRYRGVEALLDAFARIEDPGARLVVAGRLAEPALRPSMDAAAARDDRVRIDYGFVPDQEVAVYMQAADVVVLPYADVLTSGSALLALSFGRAVVAPRLGSIPDVVDRRGGVLYEPGEPDGLERALRDALAADLTGMGEHNARRADGLGWPEIAEATEAIYRACAGRARATMRVDALAAGPWANRERLLERDLRAALPPSARLALADEGAIGPLHDAHDVVPFPEREGVYQGAPGTDQDACHELARLAATGSRYLAIAWPAFWWFDEFPRFRRRLSTRWRRLLRTDRVVVYELRGRGLGG